MKKIMIFACLTGLSLQAAEPGPVNNDPEEVVEAIDYLTLDNLLRRAIRSGNLNSVKALIDQGADVNMQDNIGFPPLGIAIMCDHADIVEFLIRKGANVNMVNQQRAGKTPLHIAVEMCRSDSVKHLIGHGADLHKKNYEGYTPLRMSSDYKQRNGEGSAEALLDRYLNQCSTALKNFDITLD